jgi:hypothetical protein
MKSLIQSIWQSIACIPSFLLTVIFEPSPDFLEMQDIYGADTCLGAYATHIGKDSQNLLRDDAIVERDLLRTFAIYKVEA